MKQGIEKAIRETLVVQNPKGVKFTVDRMVRLINDSTKLNSEVTLVFGDKEGNTVRIQTTIMGMLEKNLEDFYEELEPECTSASCNNESQNFCDCGGSFEDYEIKEVLLKQD